MEETPTIRFNWAKITTDEFAIVEKYDPTIPADITIHMGFDTEPADKIIALQVKVIIKQQQKVCLVLAVTSFFVLPQEDWAPLYNSHQKILTVDIPLSLHLASLSLSTLRGVLHVKTEGLSINTFVLPPINVAEMVKERVVIAVV